jgi:probable F420-dependent oxidoreductase
MGGERQFRFGVMTHDWAWSGIEAWQEKARRLEAAGYSTFLAPDHLNEQFGAIPALTAAALATTTLRLGTLVLSNDFRHPVILAKDAATLDLLSGGRLELGLGAGWKRSEYEQAGIPFDAGPVRLQRLEESLQLLKALFGDAPATFRGAFYAVTDLNGEPKPAQRPHPPLLSGGGGKQALGVAARQADIVSLIPRSGPRGPEWATATEAATEEKLAWVREAAGDRFPHLELCATIFALTITDDRRGALAPWTSRFGLTDEEILASPNIVIGSEAEIGDQLLQRRERFGLSYFVVPEVFADAFAPVVKRLAGT